MKQQPVVSVLHDDDSCPRLPIVDGEGEARAVVWPGVGAHLRSIHRISLAPGSRTVRQQHPMEAVYYVMSGSATVHDDETQTSEAVREGSMTLVDPGTPYRFVADGDGVELVGGPCPADPSMYEHL